MNEKIAALLNAQINKEFYSAYLYLDMSNYYDGLDLDGYANYYMIQAQEERDHALLFMKYMQNNGLKVTLEAMGSAIFNTRRPLRISYSFYEELMENNALTSYPIPFLILHGEYDDYIPREDIMNLRRLSERSKLVIIPGASHRFLEEGAWDMVLDLTRDWFDYEQVLLADSY